MIVIVTCEEVNPKTGKEEVLVSHGVNTLTMGNICLPCETLDWYIDKGYAYYNFGICEWVLNDKEET